MEPSPVNAESGLKRVLVVDPHPTLRTVLAQRLRQDGHLAAAVASAGEAVHVAAWCASLGVRHVTLRWSEGKALRGQDRSPQADARQARYDLMTAWCREEGIDTLCLAHHADDQAETFLMRLARGSGVDGLAAIAPSTARDGVRLLRPLLGFPKAALLATCRAFDQIGRAHV